MTEFAPKASGRASALRVPLAGCLVIPTCTAKVVLLIADFAGNTEEFFDSGIHCDLFTMTL
jgi:hypothetical protein